ncbi:dihydrofolate reductase [Leptotrichia sp. oral taxon 223]|uniref:dihydrofolate reductase n=1 Tax=Leptotrichia sp. oral taxon 223 TaxID=712363 RepID=UPI0015B826BB|nr:dihydrofolate reductase [Leptotrichia sp. oral taxon 223]NWO19839.1 dihydrofolate reductase [Leptotrichia sp. oral taxon 223]
MFSLIVAVGKNNEIGKNNQLLWHIPEDLKNFKKITAGKTVIMGRNTYESIGRALPNRKNIVLSRNFLEAEKKFREDRKKYENETTRLEFYDDFQKVIERYKDLTEEVFIIGGGEIYKKSLEMGIIKRIYMSHVDFSDNEADAYFPKINLNEWITLTEGKYDGWKFCIYEKVNI